MKLTRNDAQEVLHKLAILADEPDLQADYGISQAQADTLRDSVPHNGGEWTFAPEFAAAVKGEMEDHVRILHHCAHLARRANEIGQALTTYKLAKRLEEAFE